MSLLDIVRGYAAGGLSCIPVLANGTKAPALPMGHPVLNRCRCATPAELDAWFDDRGWGVAIQGGERSGGLVVFDFDGPAGLALYERWADDLEQEVPGLLAALPQVQTPRGRHVYARCPGHAPGNQKLARGVDGKAVIETRGEGGYVLAPGCPCECHPDRKMYVLAPGPALAEVPTVTQDQLACLLDLARARDASPREEVRPAAAPVPADEQRPGDIFNVRGAWEDVLVGAGWTRVRERGGLTYWRRPGKSDPGCSATTGIRSECGKDLLYVFSTNAHPFQDARSYTKFAAHALLNHGGDWGAAARELRGRGFVAEPDIHGVRLKYGERNGETPSSAPAPTTFPLPVPISLLEKADPHRNWLWHGYLSRGEVTLFTALWKSGKTTLLAHLLRAMETGESFLGGAVLPCRVLCVTEETGGQWAERRDRLGLKDHIEMIVRPFKARPTWPVWFGFLDHLGNLIRDRKFDLLVLDTISKMWPVDKENDASQVDSALLPFHGAIGGECACLLDHHPRKADGEDATSSRGSGALPAFCDTILEMRRYQAGKRDDRRRVLTGYGRHEETPGEVVIELTEAGYIRLGDRQELANLDLVGILRDILPAEPPGWRQEEVVANWPVPVKPARQRLTEALHHGAEVGLWQQDGEGRKGSPFTFWRVDR